jgi:hypothetical protein
MSNVLSSPARAGTEAAAETQRHAYNCAFDELGLPWHWDAATYGRLLGHGPDGVRRYLETERPHLLRAYEPEFLVAAVEAAKARRLGGPRQ